MSGKNKNARFSVLGHLAYPGEAHAAVAWADGEDIRTLVETRSSVYWTREGGANRSDGLVVPARRWMIDLQARYPGVTIRLLERPSDIWWARRAQTYMATVGAFDPGISLFEQLVDVQRLLRVRPKNLREERTFVPPGFLITQPTPEAAMPEVRVVHGRIRHVRGRRWCMDDLVVGDSGVPMDAVVRFDGPDPREHKGLLGVRSMRVYSGLLYPLTASPVAHQSWGALG